MNVTTEDLLARLERAEAVIKAAQDVAFAEREGNMAWGQRVAKLADEYGPVAT